MTSVSEAMTLERIESMPEQERLAWARGRPEAGEALGPLVEQVKGMVLADAERAGRLSAVLVDVAAAVGRPPLLARARTARAHALAAATRYEESLAQVELAVRDAEQSGSVAEAAGAHLVAVQPLSRLGRLSEALGAARRAAELFARVKDAVGAAKAAVNAGVILRQLDDPESALGQFAGARPAFANAPLVVAQIDSNTAEALLELNRFGEAEAAFVSALQQLQAAGNRRAAAFVEGNLADLLHRQGRLGESLKRFESAIRAFESESAPGELARLRAERAEVFAGVGLLAEAEADLDLAIPELRARAMAPELCRAALARAGVCLGAGRPRDARPYLDEAASGFTRLGHRTGLARAAMLTGRMLAASGEPARAAEALRGVLERVADRPADRALAATALGLLLVTMGQAAAAAPVLDDAVRLADDLGMTPLLAEALHARARQRLAIGSVSDAIADLNEAMEAIDRMRGRLPGEGFRVAFAGGRAPVYEDAIRALLGRGRARDGVLAFEVVERARCRGLLDLIRGDLSRDGGLAERDAAPLLSEHASCKAELNALYSLLLDPGRGRQARSARDAWRGRVDACEQRLATLESRLASTREFRGVFSPAAGVPEVGALLEADGVFVEYALANGRMFAFVIGSGGLRGVRDLGAAGPIEDLVARLGLQIGRALARGVPGPGAAPGLVRDARAELGALHGALIAPIDDLLAGAARLIIAPAGSLHRVPFEGLFGEDRYLVERFSISYTPSGSVLQELTAGRGPGAGAAGHTLVVGVPDEQAPWIGAEAEAVAALVPGARLLLGADATVERFQREARGAALIHLASHAIAPDASPVSGRLKFSDRWLLARDLADLPLEGCVVVMSACETGRGMSVGSEEAYGLVRAMVVAGARSVIATRWRVHDRTTAAVMKATYERLGRGPGAVGDGSRGVFGRALREVQIEAVAQGQHPAAWAPFLVMGGAQ